MEDCFFFIDYSVPEEERKISTMCVECEKKHKPIGAWFYEGTVNGYGEFDYKCCACKKIVHSRDEYEGDFDTD